VRAALDTARELGEQLLSLAQHVQDPALLLEAHLALGTTLFFGGEFVPARAHLEQGMALYEPQQHRSHTLLYGQDPGGMSLAFAAWTLWHLGYPAQALQRIQEALSLAQELSHPYSLAFALALGARLYQLRREGPAAQAQAEASIRLCADQGFAQFLSQGMILREWALAAQGQEAEGIIQMHQGLTAWRTTGAELVRPYYLALVAEAYGHVGQAEEGLRLVAEALVAADHSGERFYESELYRLKGEFLLALPTGNHAEAESCFHQALDIARRQEAKSLELRAAMSLSRLWQQQGKRDEARELLAPIYAWFTEGFDTADLQEAKALLDEWS
jgi:predicted ATPase